MADHFVNITEMVGCGGRPTFVANLCLRTMPSLWMEGGALNSF
jgi:hypothetical protein